MKLAGSRVLINAFRSDKFIAVIKNTYDGMSCKVLHEGALTDKIEVKTGVRQGCLLSPFLFLLAVD